MCTCRKDLEAKLTERFKQQSPEANGHAVSLQGYGYTMSGNSMAERGYMPAEATAQYPVKKTGDFKAKTIRQNMFFSFCPFCGEKVAA
jgi:hypothetical protein